MSSTTVDSGPKTGQLVNRAVETLLAYHSLEREDLAANVDIPRSTLYRRLQLGNWKVDEVGKVAVFFGVSVDRLYAGMPLESEIPADTLRLSRQYEPAGQGRFSGSDIDEFIDATGGADNHAHVA